MKPEKYFYLEDGGIIKNLKDLGMRLDKIASNVFELHVNKEKNDFANWAEHVFKDKQLASLLRSTTDQLKMQVIVLKRLLTKRTTKSIKKFKCPICNKGFPTKVGLSVHKTIAHKKG